MQQNVSVTLVGNVTADLELNYTKAGTAVTNFNVASTPRFFDAKNEEWKDGETVFTRCVLWGSPAENAIESFGKGDRVVAVGNMSAKPWEDEDGNKRINYELVVSDIGPSIQFATTEVTRNTKLAGDEDEEEVKKPVAKKPATRKPATRKR